MKAFISSLISDAFSEVSGAEVLPLESFGALDAPVCTHADMLVLVIGKTVFCYEDYYNTNKKIFDLAALEGYEIVTVLKKCASKYPHDIALNVLVLGKYLLANLKYVAKEVLEYAKNNGYSLVNVKQGYSACSTLVLDENNVITADKGICNTILSIGKHAALIEQGAIMLKGYNYGFIGGASCVIGKSVYFFGDIKAHPSYDVIHSEIECLHMNEISVTSGDVFDFGGARLIF